MFSIFVQEELSSQLLQNTNNSNESTLETVEDSSDTHITYDWHSMEGHIFPFAISVLSDLE